MMMMMMIIIIIICSNDSSSSINDNKFEDLYLIAVHMAVSKEYI
jgi:hypothetical protein